MPVDLTPLAKLLKNARERAGYSRARAAQLSGVKAGTIEAWETGRVTRPGLHDVYRLALVLGITADIERAVLAELLPLEVHAHEIARGSAAGRSAAPPLIERAMTLVGWDLDDVAEVLNTTPDRIRELREGAADLTVLESLALIAVIASYPSARSGAGNDDIARLLTQLRTPQA